MNLSANNNLFVCMYVCMYVLIGEIHIFILIEFNRSFQEKNYF